MRGTANVKILIVLAMLGYGLSQIIIARDGNYVAVNATLLAAYTETYTSSSRLGTSTEKERHHFLYQYTLDGKVYTSHRYTHVYPKRHLGVAQFRGEKKGATITAYVHPSFPSYAVVKKDSLPYFIYVLTLSGLLGIVHCLAEMKLTRLDAFKPENQTPQTERIRKVFTKSGAGMGFAIFVMFFMLMFDI